MTEKRLYYIDWLRVLVILMLIPYHSALTFTGLGDVYIKAPLQDSSVLPFLCITAPLDSFMMTLLFFVSGIASFFSLTSRGKGSYVKERVKKVLLPFVAGTLLLCPVQAYFQGLNEGFTGSLIQFIPQFFSGKIVHYLGYAHLWFLLYLFLFSMMCLPLFLRWTRDRSKLGRIAEWVSKGNRILLPMLFLVVAEALLRPFYPGKQTFIMDWANVVVYGSVYIFGFVFASDARIGQQVHRMANWSKVLFPTLAVGYIALQYLYITHGVTMLPWALTKGLYECAAIIFFLWLGQRYLNKKSATLRYLNQSSFRYYIFHFIPVSMFTYVFLNTGYAPLVKYFLVVVCSYAFVAVVNEGIRRASQLHVMKRSSLDNTVKTID